jgi:hypothetical protein
VRLSKFCDSPRLHPNFTTLIYQPSVRAPLSMLTQDRLTYRAGTDQRGVFPATSFSNGIECSRRPVKDVVRLACRTVHRVGIQFVHRLGATFPGLFFRKGKRRSGHVQ